jgi:hypothetical protein
MKPYNNSAATLMLQIAPSNVKELVKWLDENRNKNEYIEATHWMDDRWHIWLRDKTITDKSPADAMIGFGVNVALNDIMWLNPSTSKPMTFIRSYRWMRLFKQQFPAVVRFGHFDDYRNSSGPHLKRRKSRGQPVQV